MADVSNDPTQAGHSPEPNHGPERKRGGWLRKRAARLALFSIAALLVTGLLAGLASGHSMSRFQKILNMKELNLTAEQSEQIADILIQTRKEMIQLKAAFKVSRIELAELLTEAQVDEAAVADKAEQIGQSAQQLVQLRSTAALEVRRLLTPEQVKKAKPRLMELLSRSHGGWGHRGHKEYHGGRGHGRHGSRQ